jgi:sugar phosphate isomerase/epimerase
MKYLILISLSILMMIGACTNSTSNSSQHEGKDTLQTKSIRLALQTWSFNKFSFEEAIKFASEMGFKYIEMYPGQKISNGSDGNTHFTTSKENREKIKSILETYQVGLIQYGVVSCKSADEWIQLFEFAREMGIETINSEPEFEYFPLLDSLTNTYGINLAVHNHAKPTIYWDPQIVLDQIKNYGPRIGVCGDNGHWMRSGLDPVESLKKVEGRLLGMHLKDMNVFNNLEAHTMSIGTGVLDLSALVAELKRQNFSGVLTIENEYNWENPQDDIKTSLKNVSEKLL